jgi:hypothetical protein
MCTISISLLHYHCPVFQHMNTYLYFPCSLLATVIYNIMAGLAKQRYLCRIGHCLCKFYSFTAYKIQVIEYTLYCIVWKYGIIRHWDIRCNRISADIIFMVNIFVVMVWWLCLYFTECLVCVWDIQHGTKNRDTPEIRKTCLNHIVTWCLIEPLTHDNII